MERGHLVRIPLRREWKSPRSFSQPTVEGDNREFFGQCRTRAVDMAVSVILVEVPALPDRAKDKK